MVPVFWMGSRMNKQCARRDDGVWFIRHRRHDAPGFTRWMAAPFTERPQHAWYSGKHGRLPCATNHSGSASDVCEPIET